MSDVTRSVPDSIDRCPACGEDGLTVPFDEIEAVCNSCGIVIYDWKDPSLEEQLDHEHSKNNLPVSWSEVRPAHNSTQYRFSNAIELIEQVSIELSIPSPIRIRAAELYIDAAIEGVPNGRSVTTVATGTLYIASKAASEPRALKRFTDAADIEHTELSKTVRYLYRELSKKGDLKRTVTAPEDYLGFLCSDLDLNREVVNQAEVLLHEMQQQVVFDGKHPAGIAAAAVYLTAENPPTQRDLAVVAGVATETLRVRLNEFRATREQDNV